MTEAFRRLQTEVACMNEVNRDELIMEKCRELGYARLRFVPDRGVCGILRFIYTVGVCYGLDETGYAGRFCFDTAQNAALFLQNWDGETLPVIGEDGCTAIK